MCSSYLSHLKNDGLAPLVDEIMAASGNRKIKLIMKPARGKIAYIFCWEEATHKRIIRTKFGLNNKEKIYPNYD